MTAPIIKWAGGKTKLLPDLCKRMPPRFRTYYEPFFGGGALFFHQLPKNAIISDLNTDLYALYLAVRDETDAVIDILRGLQTNHRRKSTYEQIRNEWNRASDRGLWSLEKRAAFFIYLNKTCFNGLWRVNSEGKFNVPKGDYPKGHVICDEHKIRAAARALAPAHIRFGHYTSNCMGAKDGDLVYFDPPYDPVNKTSNFTAYTSSTFGETEQWNLMLNAERLIHQGAFVMLSNSNTRFIRKIYRESKVGFKLHRVSAPRSINSKASKRGNVSELIITGGY